MCNRWWIAWLMGLLCCSDAVDAQTIPAGYRRVALEYDLPPGLLYAVALTESGQRGYSHGRFRPWPWTLNIDGKGRYFSSRQSAWHTLKAELGGENRSVDIGLMQLNWRYHREALGSAWLALDPYHNLRVAASILRRCSLAHSDWLQSAGCYHAPNHAARAQAYAERVRSHWARLENIPEGVWFERP